MTETKEQCGICKYWIYRSSEPGYEEGYCRYNPPTVRHGFPKTNIDMWCGKYEKVK